VARVTYDHVTKRFDGVVAVDDLMLEVRDGEFMVLVGPSGCGKSTALRMLAGLEDVTSGDVYIGERRVTDVPPRDRDVAMVFQSYALYPHMSVYENLAFGLQLRKTPRSDVQARVQRAAEMLGIETLLRRKPRELSGGQRQRVALGRAIVREPQVFLMDEPLSNLDAKLRVQTRAELIRLHERLRTTTIYVTHDQVEAMTMGQRIAVMRDGVLQQVDGPQALYATPANIFVAGFIGSPSMNFFAGELARDQDTVFVRRGSLRLSLAPTVAREIGPRTDPHVILGIRPEHITDPREKLGPTIAPLRARVNVVEPVGAEVFAYLQTDDETELVARIDARYTPRTGDMIDVAVATDRVHLFDPVTEVSLLYAPDRVTEAPPLGTVG
jgi:multiple sugar transport system ATP-binding protein